MRTRRKPGMPASFELGVSADQIPDDAPADLGDFLDEDASFASPPHAAVAAVVVEPPPAGPPKVIRMRGGPEESPAAKIALETPEARDVQPPTRIAARGSQAVVVDEEIEFSGPQAQPRRPKQPPRKQINMKPQTLQMAEEVIAHVQKYGPQKDAKASEVFHALVAAAHGALDELDLSKVPARGRWGSPTARAFIESLEAEFERAIHRRQKHLGA